MFDIIVIGGGTSGLMAAVQAAQRGAKVLILEKNKTLGRKLLLTGGGRCNVTNNRPASDIVAHIPGNGRFLYSAFSQFDNQDIMAFFQENGVSLKEEDHGRMFPTTDRARTILDTLLKLAERYQVTIQTESPVQKLLLANGQILGVRLQNKAEIRAKSVIVAVGGATYPKTGSTGDGYAWAKQAGHTIAPLFPTEVPLTSSEAFIADKTLQGLSLRNVALSVLNAKGKAIVTHQMDMIFTHFGISGPAVLRCSSFVYKEQEKRGTKTISLKLDCLPDLSASQLLADFKQHQRQEGQKEVKSILKTYLPERLALFLLGQLHLSEKASWASLSDRDLSTLVEGIKNWTFTVNGSLPLEKAFVTGGGVSIKEIQPQTMMSKLVEGLYFCGEVLDIYGYTGGYNITAAFVTGALAGRSAAGY